ncbi:GTPase ObgE [Clostridiisalibacter paucivorans]|uniref:GTPase ObgE n=1 Tax=Clostridiisalibacter paucivorans TaxID=408753 RepID=UPI00047EFE37|nr:GTPase ObgE [Clostridiisalibacter paucivorans]
MFVDKAKIFVKAGNGGHGAVAWRREKYEPSGGPAGGDGGSGGNVVLKVDEGLRTLMDFKYKKHYNAQNGEDGKSKRQFGKKGENLYIKVPPGTIVKDVATGKIISDLIENGQEFIVAKGGKGGRGNAKFATATRQAPRFAEGGSKGEEREIILELKVLADVGLVGFPNVGKSTFLSVVSQAKPKIANYHFTTLKPNLGVVRLGEGKSFVIADIPGLIEGAHEGIGLGHEFLRHVERTRILIHMVDISGQEGRDPFEDFNKINEELQRYNPKLASRPQIVVANKMDLTDSEKNLNEFKNKLEKTNCKYELFSISAATRKGIKELLYRVLNKLDEVGDPEPLFAVEEVTSYQYKGKEDEVIVRKEDGKFIVEGNYVEKVLNSTNFDDFDSTRYFQRKLREKGIIDQLKKLGVNDEDIVNICGYEFEFFE